MRTKGLHPPSESKLGTTLKIRQSNVRDRSGGGHSGALFLLETYWRYRSCDGIGFKGERRGSNPLGASLWSISRVLSSPVYIFPYIRNAARMKASNGQPPLSQCMRIMFWLPSKDNQLSLERRKWWIISMDRIGQPSYWRG